MKKIEKAHSFYKNRIKAWMLSDLRKTLPAKTNFLTTLGCLVYTEVIGTFLPPLENEKGSSKSKRFYRCLFRLKSGDYLKNIDHGIKKDTGRNLYEHLRHNMSHVYLPSIHLRRNGKILFLPIIVARDGFFRVNGKLSDQRTSPIFIDSKGLTIANKNYVIELEEAVELFYKETFINENIEYQNSAIQGINHILKENTINTNQKT